MTRLALAGCTVPQIAAITGHMLKNVEAILGAHYLGGTLDLAEAAIKKLNFRVRIGNIIANRMLTAHPVQTGTQPNCLIGLVAHAVAFEPVSAAEFPANREKNREFCKILASGAPETENNGVVIGLPIRIPYSTEQGNILEEQGVLARKQGKIFPAEEPSLSAALREK